MKKLFTLLAVMGLAIVPVVVSQNITFRFTGATNGGNYIRLDSVRVQDTNRSWTETLVYPDTVLTLGQSGILDAQSLVVEMASYPNPFRGATNVTVAMPQRGDATLQVFTLAGQKVSEQTMFLGAGNNLFKVHLKNPQVYLLTVTTPQGRRTIKLLNRGTSSSNCISFQGNGNVVEKRQSSQPFQNGDVLRIVGYATHNGSAVASNEVLQPQSGNGNFTLVFTLSVVNNPVFSVSASTRVVFSPGNLQWSATGGGSTDTTHAVAGGGTAAGIWRFAEHQWDTMGAGNRNISYYYTGWIDLFGWGTSGYNNKYPYMTSTTYSDYGNGTNDISGTNYDWGVYNAIYNPQTSNTDAPGTWRTLTNGEWIYLLNTRSTPSGIRFALATVNGVAGLIILPDNWSASTYSLNRTNSATTAEFTSNVISLANWSTLENAGAVFVPAAGMRNNAAVLNVGSACWYWSSSALSTNDRVAYRTYFVDRNVSVDDYSNRHNGLSVRLVKNVN